MARFTISRYTAVQTGRYEYKDIKVGKYYWFEANSTDEAINTMRSLMDNATFIVKIQTENGFKPFYKASKYPDGTIKVHADKRAGC